MRAHRLLLLDCLLAHRLLLLDCFSEFCCEVLLILLILLALSVVLLALRLLKQEFCWTVLLAFSNSLIEESLLLLDLFVTISFCEVGLEFSLEVVDVLVLDFSYLFCLNYLLHGLIEFQLELNDLPVFLIIKLARYSLFLLIFCLMLLPLLLHRFYPFFHTLFEM